MDFKGEREKRGWTIRDVVEMLDNRYSISTINGLENRGEGSDRLKEDLERLYGNRNPSELREGEDVRADLDLWRRRAKSAEKNLDKLRDGLKRLLEQSSPTPVSSSQEAGLVQEIGEHVISTESQQRSARAPKSQKPSRHEASEPEADS